MKSSILFVFLFGSILLITGCGLKGDLSFPKETEETNQTMVTVDDSKAASTTITSESN